MAWRPGNEYVFTTGAYDGCVSVWDVRSNVALGMMREHSGKVLCVAWEGKGRVVSGGEDGHVRSCSIDSVHAS